MSFAQFIHNYVLNKRNSITKIFCPITEEVMKNPVFYTINGVEQVFERAVIEDWRKRNPTCPNTRQDISQLYLKPYRPLIQIRDFLDEEGEVQPLSWFEQNLSLKQSAFIQLVAPEFLAIIKSNNLDKLQEFKELFPFIDQIIDEDHWTPLHYAASRGHVKMVEFLLNIKVPLNIQTNNGWTALHWAIHGNYLQILKLLLQAGAEVKSLPVNPLVAVQSSRSCGDLRWQEDKLEIIKHLLSHKIDINSKDGVLDQTILHREAQIFGNQEIIEHLIKWGADVNALDKNKDTPLHEAVDCKNNEAVVETLLLNKANPMMKNGKNQTPKERIMKRDYYQECFTKTIELLKSYEKKISAKIREEKRIKHELIKQEKLKKFIAFSNAYSASYNQAGFFSKLGAEMKTKISNGSVKNIDDVIHYAKLYPMSRTAHVLNNLQDQEEQSQNFAGTSAFIKQ